MLKWMEKYWKIKANMEKNSSNEKTDHDSMQYNMYMAVAWIT